VGDVALKVGNSLEKASPAIALGASMIAPEFAPAIIAGTTVATNLSHQIHNGAKAGQTVTNQLARQVNNKANTVIGQARQAYGNGKSNIASQCNDALMKQKAISTPNFSVH
jgi:hypothetical protein